MAIEPMSAFRGFTAREIAAARDVAKRLVGPLLAVCTPFSFS
jgi:hypothetical protein